MMGEWINGKVDYINLNDKLISINNQVWNIDDKALSYASNKIKEGENIGAMLKDNVIVVIKHDTFTNESVKPSINEPTMNEKGTDDEYNKYQIEVFKECMIDAGKDRDIAIAYFNLRCSPKYYYMKNGD